MPKIRFATLAFFMLLWLIISALLYWYQQNQRQTYLQQRYQQSKDTLCLIQKDLYQVAQYIHQTQIRTPQILQTLAQAHQAWQIEEASRLEQLRGELFQTLYPTYLNMKKLGIRQLHFHLPGSISLLRFHRPQKWGDDLSLIRYDIDLVNFTHEPITGFEEGRIFNGFRSVFPLFWHQKFIGSVEISFGPDAFNKTLHQSMPTALRFVVKKSLVQEKLFRDESNNYQTTLHSQQWVTDRNALKVALKVDTLSPSAVNAINQQLDLDRFLTRAQPIEHVTWQNKDFLLAAYPVYNVQGDIAAYQLLYQADPHIKAMRQDFYLLWSISTLGLLIISLLLYRIFYLKHLKKMEALHLEAHQDPLTGAWNRYELIDIFPKLSHIAERSQHPISLLFFDIDHFKKINDTHGHGIGDDVLKEVVQRVKQHLRKQDLIIRWGGEEFIILLPHTSLEAACLVAEKLRQAIETHPFTHQDIVVTCSFGVAVWKPGQGLNTLIECADQALYHAKDNGRNQVISEHEITCKSSE